MILILYIGPFHMTVNKFMKIFFYIFLLRFNNLTLTLGFLTLHKLKYTMMQTRDVIFIFL